jgi:hypothetical protein
MSVLCVLTLSLPPLQVARATAVGLALLAGGCASQQSGTQTSASAHGTAQPVQLDPSDAPPDDAKEPWSPHYGWQPRTPESAPSYAPIPVERVTGTTRYAKTDPDSVIRHAVAAHEMRRQ